MMTSSATLTICGDVVRSARLALTELIRGQADDERVSSVTGDPQQATAATIALARLVG
jgi:hypothetical protein